MEKLSGAGKLALDIILQQVNQPVSSASNWSKLLACWGLGFSSGEEALSLPLSRLPYLVLLIISRGVRTLPTQNTPVYVLDRCTVFTSLSHTYTEHITQYKGLTKTHYCCVPTYRKIRYF